MAICVAERFTSCLDGFTDTQRRKGFVNHCARFVATAGGRDKVLKMVDPILDTVGEIAKASGASRNTLEGIDKGRSFAKAGRDALAFFNIFNGVIQRLVYYIGQIIEVAARILGKKDALKKNGRGLQENLLELGFNCGRGVGAATYIVAFGVCRPISNLDKYIRDDHGNRLIPMSKTALKLGARFATVMMANHISELVGDSCEIGLTYRRFQREKRATDLSSQLEQFETRMASLIVGTSEKVLELLMDIVQLTGRSAPAWFRLPVNLSIGGLGLYKEWKNTA